MNTHPDAQTLQMVADFLAPLERLSASALASAVAQGLIPLTGNDREALVRQLIHWEKVPDVYPHDRPGATLIHEVIHQTGADVLLEGILERNDIRLLTCLDLSSAQARQLAWNSFASGSDKKSIQLALAQHYPEATLSTLVAGFWGYEERLFPELDYALDNWLIRTPKGLSVFVHKLCEEAEEYQGVGSHEVALTIGMFGMTQSRQLAEDIKAEWVERYGGGILAHWLVQEAFRHVDPYLKRGQPWSEDEQANFAQWTRRSDAEQLAHQANTLFGNSLDQMFGRLSKPVQMDQGTYAQKMVQAILQIMDREHIGDPWRTVWRVEGPLKDILTADMRAKELQTRPPSSPSRHRRRS